MKTSHISNEKLNAGDHVSFNEIREGIRQLIIRDYPDFAEDKYISYGELNKYRRLFLSTLIEQERGELDTIDRDVINALKNNSILSENIQDEIEQKLTLGQRMADKIATFGGSWTFITLFLLFIVIWIIVNISFLMSKPFDPYPFIFLNLLLSCLAAMQAPIIMMSQNRLEQKDRIRAEHDYKVNLKAELEIRLINEKIDHLMIYQNKKLLEIQEVQVDYLEDLVKHLKKDNKSNNQ